MKRSAVLVLLVCAISVESAYAQVVNQPSNLTATVVGNRVTLRWQAPPSVSQPLTGYLIEAGVSPGTTAVSLALGNVLVYGVTAPNGRYFVRVRALFGATPGPPSNGVEVFVGVRPPAAPANFTATVTHFTVAFTWTYGANSSGVTGWQLHAGSAPGLSDLAVVSFSSTTRSFTATAPAGTYYVRVYALNHAGPSPPSAELTVVTGPGICDLPFTPTGFSALAGQGGVRLQWNPWSGPLPAGYLLAAGSAPGASDVGTFPLPRSTVLTTFAPEGTYYARLAAYNACGATPFGSEISFTVLPPSDASLIGTWNGTVSHYTKPYPWTPITSFQLTLNANPSGTGGPLPGMWSDNKGCRNSRIFGSAGALPSISMESLECNDGDFILTIAFRSATVVEGRCNSGPDCSFRMTRQ